LNLELQVRTSIIRVVNSSSLRRPKELCDWNRYREQRSPNSNVIEIGRTAMADHPRLPRNSCRIDWPDLLNRNIANGSKIPPLSISLINNTRPDFLYENSRPDRLREAKALLREITKHFFLRNYC
jgi:hypothetical protein